MKPEELKSLGCSIARISALAGGFSYYYCFISHVCMAGHMHHPPYTTIDFMVDSLWMSFLIIAILTSLFCLTKRMLTAAGCLVVLIIDRSLLESLGGMGILIEIPLLTLAIIMMIPSDWFAGLARRHIYIPLLLTSLFLFAGLLESLRIHMMFGYSWWLGLNPKGILGYASLIAIVLVIITNEIIMKTMYRKKKVQPVN